MGTAPATAATAPAPAQTDGNGSSVKLLTSTESPQKQLEAAAQENGVPPSPASQATNIDPLGHTASAGEATVKNGAAPEATSERLGSRSPEGTTIEVDGPADIPSQKLAFGEDQRALKALDKVFI